MDLSAVFPNDDMQPGEWGRSLENYSEFATGRFNEIAQVKEREMMGICGQVLVRNERKNANEGVARAATVLSTLLT